MTTANRATLPLQNRPVLPLEHGDRLTREEFERRWEAMPDLKRAELLDGMVYLAANYRGRILDHSIPPLENGDRLTRAEFERRWENMPDLKKAELLDGEVFISPPVSAGRHGIPHSKLMAWIGAYWMSTPGIAVADNSTLHLQSGSDAQPDAMAFLLPEHGGKARLDDEGYVEGVPELVAEVASSSASYDLHTKYELYRRHGVAEYVVWRVRDAAVDWFALRDGAYQPLAADADGVFRSRVLPGLWLDAAALDGGDLPRLMSVLQQGTASPDHAAFVRRLAPARGGGGPNT